MSGASPLVHWVREDLSLVGNHWTVVVDLSVWTESGDTDSVEIIN